jgi:hypothetical protein
MDGWIGEQEPGGISEELECYTQQPQILIIDRH